MRVKSAFMMILLFLSLAFSFALVSEGGSAAESTNALHIAAYPGDSVVILEWSETFEFSSFHIFRGLSPDNLTFYAVKQYAGFTDDSVVNGVTYYYSVNGYSIDAKGPSSFINAMPRPGPIDLQYSPQDLPNCDPFDLRISWALPAQNTTNVTAFKIYPEYGAPLLFDRNVTSTIFHIDSGWGPHILRLSAVYSDGRESYAPKILVHGPMCEGSSDLSYLFIFPFVLVILAIIVALFYYSRRK